MRYLVDFNARGGESELALRCATFVKSISCLNQKTVEELCITTLKNDAKFEEGLTCALKKDMMNLTNFDPTLKSLEVCTLMSFY